MFDPDTDIQAHTVKITAHLTFYTAVPGNTGSSGARSKNKTEQKKETKAKEFSHSFESGLENYLQLLKTILAKHGEEKYNVMDRMTYGIKVQLPSVKYTLSTSINSISDIPCRKGDALDIDNFAEYQDLVKDIIEGMPSKMNIYIDMADIQKRWSGRGSQGSDNEDEDAGLYDANGLSDLERELARLRGKIEKKYQNDHNAGYTYIDPKTGTSHPLTPQMMKEWCRAMYDGEATINQPPGFIADFYPAYRQVALHPTRIAASVNNKPTTDGVGDVIGHLATIVTALVGRPVPDSAVPSTPQRTHLTAPTTAAAISSPVIPSPTKLPRFLEHAEAKQGVTTARNFESVMLTNGYGPDIIHLLDDQALVDCGFTKGDALRIKAGAGEWWKGPDAKRKRVQTEEPGSGSGSGSTSSSTHHVPHTQNNVDVTPPSKKVAFEHRYDDGGRERFYDPRLTPGRDGDEADTDTWFRSGGGQWLPLPLGYRAVHDYECEENEGDEEDQERRFDAANALASLQNTD
ncbi:hypothetical protein C8R44DRAFT_642692 [Mycena epipterygia]|nr:hypothetical protein C8R44DRAFT_642692 [Mycena epipterygia]